MIRYLVDVYKVEFPDDWKRRDDIQEDTEDVLNHLGKNNCYSHQVQGKDLADIAKQLQWRHERMS